MKLYQLLYVSAASTPFDEAALAALLERARTNNASLDITGMLLYDNGSFIQALEGPADSVKTLYARIRRDPRHKSVRVLSERYVDHRDFSEWAMGFASLSKARAQGYVPLDSPLPVADGTMAHRLLTGFCEGRWRLFVQ